MRKLIIFAVCFAAVPLVAQEKPASPQSSGALAMEKPQMAQEPEQTETSGKATVPGKVAMPLSKNPATEGKVIEEVVARVNSEIVTRSDLEKARRSAEEDAVQECNGHCNPEQLRAATEDRKKNALRDLIDQSLLIQRGKDMSISVEPEVIKKLDAIRIQNKLDSMEELEKAVTAQGLNWEDFKNNIRNSLLTQAVISKEVSSHITVGHEEICAG